jgi:hypothetical protein
VAIIGDFAVLLRGSRQHLAGDYCVMWDIIHCMPSETLFQGRNENGKGAVCNTYGAEAKFIKNVAGESERRKLGTCRRRWEIPKVDLRGKRVGDDGLESYNPR